MMVRLLRLGLMMSQREATNQERVEHGWCLQLRQSQAFAYFLEGVQKRLSIAQREVCATHSPNRDFEAGRLSAFVEASQLIERRYLELRKVVEVVVS